MSNNNQTQTDYTSKPFLSEREGCAYIGVSATTFRAWAKAIGSKRKIGRRSLYDRAVIDAALKRGDAI